VLILIKSILILLFALLALTGPEPADAGGKPLWELGAGAACLFLPGYRGSDEGRIYALPYPYLIYRGDFLRIDKDHISGRILETDRLLLDVSFFGGVPVDSDEHSARHGMPDLDPSFEVGPAIDITLLKNDQGRYKLALNLPVRGVFSTDFSSIHHRGWVFSPRLNFKAKEIIPKYGINLGLSAGPLFADRKYHDYYYTVKSVYATPTRPAYSARGGYSGSTLTLGMNKTLNSLILYCFIGMDALDGAEIKDSPLVKTKYSFMGGFTVTWIFFKSEELVPQNNLKF
jgi:MipA family protein